VKRSDDTPDDMNNLSDDALEIIDLDSVYPEYAPDEAPTHGHAPNWFSQQQFTRHTRRWLSFSLVACVLLFFILLFPDIHTLLPASLFSLSSSHVSTTSSEQTIFQNLQFSGSEAFVEGSSVVPSANGLLTIFQASTGHILWKSNLYPPQTPLAWDNQLFVQANNGSLNALDITNGSVIWQSAPLPSDGMLQLVNDGVIYDLAPDHSIYAIFAPSGRILWHWHGNLAGSVSLQAVNAILYASSQQSNIVYALSAFDGHTIWQYARDGGGVIEQVQDNVVYIFSVSKTLDAVNATNGQFLWSQKIVEPDNTAYDTVVGITNQTIVIASSPYNALKALDTRNGATIWQRKLTTVPNEITIFWLASSSIYTFSQAPAIASDFSPGDSSVRMISIRSGSSAWTYQRVGNPLNVTINNNTVYLDDTKSGRISALSGSKGSTLWTYAGPNAATIAGLNNGILYLQSLQGNILALQASNHHPLWQLHIPS
jgi:outer membrane protein assembly factor BamB